MSRTIRNKISAGMETWKRISKQAGIWMFSMMTTNGKRHVKKTTNRYLRRQHKQAVKEWEESR